MRNLQQYRNLVLFLALAALALMLAACGAAAEPQVIEKEVVVTQVVEKEVEVVVTQVVEKEVEKEVVVTATPEPVADTSDEPVNLRFTVWTGSDAHLGMLNGIADAYSADHPNVTVQYDTIPFADYSTKLAVQLSGTNPPDIGWMPESLAVPFIEAGALADLSAGVKDNPDYDFSDLSESAMSLYLNGDEVNGIPFSTSPELIYFNRDLFAQAGIDTPDVLLQNGEWTWEKLAESAKVIKDATGVYGFQTTGTSIYSADHLFHNLAPIMRAFGTDVWDAAGTTCLMNTPEAVAAMQFYHDMVFADGSTVPPGEEIDFSAGGSAMNIGFLSQSARLGDVEFEWGIAPLPEGPATQESVIGQSSIVAFNASKHKDAAIDFVAFITNKENVATMAQFFPPIRQSVLTSDALLEANPAVSPEEMATAVVPSISTGHLLPTHSEFPKIKLAASAEFDNLWVPDADVQAVLDSVCEAIEPFLNN